MAGMFDLQDEEQAKQYLDQIGIEYRFQCYHEGRADGCHRLGTYMEAFKRQYDTARKVYGQNCDEKRYGRSCFKFGNYCLLGKGGPKDITTAFSAYRRGCEYSDSSSCYNAALMLEDGRANPEHKDFKAAAEFLRAACDLNDGPACHRLSSYMIVGKDGVERDMQLAFSYAKIACDQDHMAACNNLSRMYAKGDGVEQDQKLADFYKRKTQELHKIVTEGAPEIKFGQ